jgi:hypothetical protein
MIVKNFHVPEHVTLTMVHNEKLMERLANQLQTLPLRMAGRVVKCIYIGHDSRVR